MNLVVGSAFRNAAGAQIQRYFQQVAALKIYAPHHNVRVVAVEGDSTDATAWELWTAGQQYQIDTQVVTCSHGQPMFGSTESSTRMACLSRVGNAILDGVHDGDDVLIYVESDLIWEPRTIVSLIAQLEAPNVDVVAPLVMAGACFYDIWAFRRKGQRFSPFPPFHPDLQLEQLMELDSAGSCLVMKGEVARLVRMGTGALVEWCENARKFNYHIWVNPNLRIYHP